MTFRNRLIAATGLVLVVGAFLAGWWPEWQRRTAAEAENTALRNQVERLGDHAQLAQLHAQLLDLIDAVTEMNYGQAQTLSSALFDSVRAEAGRSQSEEFRTALAAMLATRDEVTGALARGDSSALDPLRRMERQLRQPLANPSAGTM